MFKIAPAPHRLRGEEVLCIGYYTTKSTMTPMIMIYWCLVS